MAQNTVIIIDAHNLLYRNHYTHSDLTSEDGFPTGAMHGALIAVHRHRVKYPHAEIIVAWDGPPDEQGFRSWRYREYPRYKASRAFDKSTQENRKMVVPQIKPLFTMLHYAGYLQYRVPGLECDDLIGVLAHQYARHEHYKPDGTCIPDYRILIDSTDKDFYQLLAWKSVRILRTIKGKVKELDSRWLVRDTGVIPKDWIAYRALTGDPSDGMPGLKGCGPVGAKKLLALGAKPGDDWQYQPSKIRDQISYECWKNVPLYYDLSRIISQVFDDRLTGKGEVCDNLDAQLRRRTQPTALPDKFVRQAAHYNLIEVLRRKNKLIL